MSLRHIWQATRPTHEKCRVEINGGIAVIAPPFFMTSATPNALVGVVEAETLVLRSTYTAQATRLAKEAGGGLIGRSLSWLFAIRR